MQIEIPDPPEIYISPAYGVPAQKRHPDWDKESKEFKQRMGMCCVCGARENLEVHHAFPYHLFPELEMDSHYWHVLCRLHHFEIGHLRSWVAWNPYVAKDIRFWNKRLCKAITGQGYVPE